MTSTERTARIDWHIAAIADEAAGDPGVVVNYALVLEKVDHSGDLLEPQVVTSHSDPEYACWLLCRAARFLRRMRRLYEQRRAAY